MSTTYPALQNGNKFVPNPSMCPTKKKQFINSAAAESFINEMAIKYPNQPRQHAYACEQCPQWHLSAMDAAAHSMVESRSNLSEMANQRAEGLPRRLWHLQTKIKEVYNQLKEKREGQQYHGIIADLGRALQGLVEVDDTVALRCYLTEAGLYKTAYHFRKTLEKQQPIRVSIETISSEEQELESRLRELKAKKQALIEAKAFKLNPTTDGTGVVIKKEFQSFTLNLTDAQELVERLINYLSENNVPSDKIILTVQQ